MIKVILRKIETNNVQMSKRVRWNTEKCYKIVKFTVIPSKILVCNENNSRKTRRNIGGFQETP